MTWKIFFFTLMSASDLCRPYYKY